MSYAANIFNVLIASPSDVQQEREEIAGCLHDWNALHGKTTGKILLPVMWESHSAPSLNDRPQAVINDQMVKDCDMLVGVFWTRIGSPTGEAQSGTVEEINWFIKQKKPVMLYFSKAKVDLDRLDENQWRELKSFKESLSQKGLLGQYQDISDLKQQLMRQLTITMREVNVSPTVDSRAIKRAAESEGKLSASTAKDKSEIKLIEYTDKSFIVVGDTVNFKEAFKEIGGGSWTRTKAGYYAWCFSKKKLHEVASLLSLAPNLSES